MEENNQGNIPDVHGCRTVRPVRLITVLPVPSDGGLKPETRGSAVSQSEQQRKLFCDRAPQGSVSFLTRVLPRSPRGDKRKCTTCNNPVINLSKSRPSASPYIQKRNNKLVYELQPLGKPPIPRTPAPAPEGEGESLHKDNPATSCQMLCQHCVARSAPLTISYGS